MPVRRRQSSTLSFTVSQRYRAPLNKVWEAATKAKHLNLFFTTGAKGDITPACTPVTWRWRGGISAVLEITACKPEASFEFHWTAPHNSPTTVRLEFSRENRRTVVRVKEWGWTSTHLVDAFDHCGGWSEFLYGLKADVQYGIDLRK